MAGSKKRQERQRQLASFMGNKDWARALALFYVTAFGCIGVSTAFGQADPVRRQAGLWQQTQTLLAFDTPQAPPAITAAVRATIGRPIVSERVCVPASAAARDTVATRLAPVTPASIGFRWARLDLRETLIIAQASDTRGSLSVEGKITPILTDIVATTQTTDPAIGPARRVQRTLIVRLGPC
jgi:hypothetical protein